MNKKINSKIRNNIFFSLIAFSIILIIFLTFVISYIVHDPIEKYLHTSELEEYVRINKLEMGFYGNPTLINSSKKENEVLEKIKFKNFEKLFTSSFETFSNYYLQNYYYEENSYNCKYWAYVWAYYHYKNFDRFDNKNISFNYIVTQTHVFVMLSHKTGYCIIDSGSIECKGDIEKWL